MILYEFGSTRAYKCRWLIKELGIEAEFRTVDLRKGQHRNPEFLAINPFGKVPALVDGDLHLHEATAICIYLADKHPESGMMPEVGTIERALCNKWLFFMANEMECHLWAGEKHTWGYPEDKRSKKAIEMAYCDFHSALGIIENEIGDRAFLVADRFTVADISLTYLLRWAKGRKLMGDFQKLTKYMEKNIEREHYPSEIFDQ